MNRHELEKRTMRFALKIIEFVATLPKSKTGEVVEFGKSALIEAPEDESMKSSCHTRAGKFAIRNSKYNL